MLKRLLIVALAVLAAPLAVELALRVSYDPEATRQEIATLRDTVLAAIPGEDAVQGDATRIPHPYLGWTERNRFGQIEREVALYQEGRGDKPFEVLIVGGSVSGLIGHKGAPRIKEVLGADPRLAGRKISVLNQGRGSFKQPQQVMLIAYLLNLGYRPDAIVNVDGFNEVALGMDNATLGSHPLYPHWPRYGIGAGAAGDSPAVEAAELELRFAQAALDAAAEDALASWQLRSGILGPRLKSRVAALASRCGALQDALIAASASQEEFDPTKGPTHFAAEDYPALLDDIVRAWVEASRQIDALARNHDILYLHVLQPTLHDPGSKPLTEREIRTGELKTSWRRGVLEGYPKLRAASAQLLDAGVAFRDATGLFRELEEDTYYDGCHFRGPGMVITAEAIAGWILEELPE